MYQVRLLGGFALEDPSGAQLRFRTRKTAALFAYLAFFSGRAHQREVLADWFWPEATGDAARQSLRMALSDIRKVLADQDAVRADRETIEVDAARFAVDTDRFRELVREGSRESLFQAVELHSGPLLQGAEEDWVMPQRSALEEEFAQAVVRLMALYCEAGEFSEGLAVGKRALAQVGDREDIHIGLIRLYAESGAPSLAIAQYEELERHLDEEWGEQPSGAARMALEAVPQGSVLPSQSTFDAPAGRIFGREAALEMLADLVLDEKESRMLTLHGPAGSGKTTLARHLAAKLARHYPGRCWVVDLTTCESVDALPSAIAAATGVSGVEPSAQLAACLHLLLSAGSLLVLDNLEHLLPQGSSVVARLAAGAAPLRIVVTSRRIMELDGERVVPVPPLELPGHETSLEVIQSAPAVQMFVARASAANPNFRLSPDNARSVVALCRHLEGLPLSISLAAQRASNQSPAQILASLSSPSGSPRIGEGRHGSLDSALRWSLDLVSPAEAQCFIAVSQFRTPFTAADAAQVAADIRAEERLGELVKSGLVECEADGERAEFHLFEMFKEVGRGLQGDRAREIAIRHFEWARWLAQGAEKQADAVLGPREADLFAAFSADVPPEVL
ncbi:MAG: BTAD domain-containing putative transcriptional regulator [Fimbriimonadaceae bacterium]